MTVPGHPPVEPYPFAAASTSGALRRPTTLTLGYAGALVAGLFSIVGSVLLIVNAKDLAAEVAAKAIADAGLGDTALATEVIDQAANTLVVRGVMGLVSGVLLTAIALATRNGALWARIVLTVLLLGGLCANGLAVSDVAPAASKVLGVTAILLSIVVVVLMFLPPTNRYARARKGVA